MVNSAEIYYSMWALRNLGSISGRERLLLFIFFLFFFLPFLIIERGRKSGGGLTVSERGVFYGEKEIRNLVFVTKKGHQIPVISKNYSFTLGH